MTSSRDLHHVTCTTRHPQLLLELSAAAAALGDGALKRKLDAAEGAIRRGLPFASSLLVEGEG